jgi:hypothetical protein
MTTTLSTYEEQREENIARNRRVLESLEIWPIANAGGSTPALLAPCPTHAVGAAGPDSESGSNHEWAGSSTSSSFDGGGSSSGTNSEPNFSDEPMVATVEPITEGLGHGGIGAPTKPAAATATKLARQASKASATVAGFIAATGTQAALSLKVLTLNLDPNTLEVTGRAASTSSCIEMHVLHDRACGGLVGSIMFAMPEIRAKLLPGINESKFKRLALKAQVKKHVLAVMDCSLLRLWAEAGVIKSGGAKHTNATNMEGLVIALAEAKHHDDATLAALVAHVQEQATVQVALWTLESPLVRAPAPAANEKVKWAYTLKSEAGPAALQKELAQMKEYWSTPDNPDREDIDSLERDSYKQIKEGSAMRFLGWAQSALNLTPSLSLYNNIRVFMQFMEFLDERAMGRGKGGAMAMTKHTHVCAAVTVLKWLHRGKTDYGLGFKDIKIIRTYRKLEAKYMKLKYKTEKKLSKEEIGNWIELQEIRKMYSDLTTTILKGPRSNASDKSKLQFHRLTQKHLIVGLFVRIPPLRSQVLRTLRISNEGYYNRMWYCEKKGVYCLWFPFHKGAGNSNMHDITIALPEDMNTVISTFIDQSQPHLCSGGANNEVDPPAPHLFNNHTTQVGFKASSFSQFVKWRVWFDLTGVAMNAHLLRDVVVTDIYDRDCSESVKDSYSIMMQHCRSTQRDTYDRRSQTARARGAMEDLEEQMSSKSSAAITEPPPQTPRPSRSPAPAACGAKNMPASPATGGGLAQITSSSSAPNPRPTPGKRKRANPNTCNAELEEEEYELRGVCGSIKRMNGVLAYQCLWEDYPSDDCTWEPAENFISKASQAMCMDHVKSAKAAGTWGANWEPPSFP